MNMRNPFHPSLPARIVVGVDDAGLSDHAVRQGIELGRLLHARVGLVHAVPTLPDTWPGLDPVRSVALTSELLTGAHKVINEHVRSLVGAQDREAPASAGAAASATAVLHAPPGGDPVRVIPGPPAKVLLEEVRPRSSDWIVLGGHRKRDLLDFGSTMRAVFAKSTVAVWVQSHPVHAIERILVPVDLSEESMRALATACALAKVLNARVHALHCFNLGMSVMPGAIDYAAYGAAFPTEDVLRAQRANFEDAMKKFDWRGVDPTIEFIEGIPTEVILDRSRTSDLIVMGTHGRTGLASVVLGGTAYAVLRRSEKPVLVTRHTERKFVLGDPD
jgi:nucleotide-binding universal stress UspA family protein